MIKRILLFKCDDCGYKSTHETRNAAKSIGWAIARDGKTCYCPQHAINHRWTGRGGANKVDSQQLTIGIT